jgi:hypothetical protein
MFYDAGGAIQQQLTLMRDHHCCQLTGNGIQLLQVKPHDKQQQQQQQHN